MTFLKRFQSSLESLSAQSSLRLSGVEPAYVVAFSGGVDSHVLLHCCKQLDIDVRAVHVHHGLQSVADYWVNHCQDICQAMDIPLDVLYVDAQPRRGQSPEEAARTARYQVLMANLKAGEYLLTAQHRDDQAETLLLQLFRTASSAGLAAMPASRLFGKGVHLRPLLEFSRSDIESFAEEQQLHWIEDPSNNDTAFDRNYLRACVMPLLQERWPEVTSQMSTVATLQANNLQVLDDMAEVDLADSSAVSQSDFVPFSYDVISVLSLNRLKQLSSARLLNMLRLWVSRSVGSPARKLLAELECGLIHTQADANPVIEFSGHQFRKYQDVLYCLKPKLSIVKKVGESAGEMPLVSWQPSTHPEVTVAGIRLKVIKLPVDTMSSNNRSASNCSVSKWSATGINLSLLTEKLSIRFRQGGEKFHPSDRKHSQSLKKLLQEAGVPPWERDSIPLLYHGDKLVAVVGYWVAREYSVESVEDGWRIEVES